MIRDYRSKVLKSDWHRKFLQCLKRFLCKIISKWVFYCLRSLCLEEYRDDVYEHGEYNH